MSSSTQYQLTARYPGNLDRCGRCGYPRHQHGSDGRCGLRFSASAGTLAAVGIAACALGGAAWLLASDAVVTAGSAAAFACLAVLILAGSVLGAIARRA